mmetsp:Transcript_18058/g.56237  ORF Transcript_18058/g.56237 Transcript_18058/m.56237 type:complete len:263 (+) Transcript_18058:264-1052(+)
MLLVVLRKVYAIPPPMIILSTLSSMFLISWILSDTLAPPRMASTGRAGASSTFANATSSLATRKPAALVVKPSPSIDECARCAVPKASETYTSPSLAREARKAATLAGSALSFSPDSVVALPSSSMWKRRFSSRITEPSAGAAHAASTSSPTQSERKVIGLPSSFSSSPATGLSENLSTREPSGRPRCDMSTTDLAPESRQCLIVGRAPSMRAVLVILLGSFLSCGTLKSTRMSTRLPFTSTLESCSLLERDMVRSIGGRVC